MATIRYVGKDPDMFQHMDFTNRKFTGLIDPQKAINPHGNRVYEKNGSRVWEFRYTILSGFKFANGKFMTVKEEISGDFWVMKPRWILEQESLRGIPFTDYSRLLDSLSLYKAEGQKMKHLISRNLIELL